MSNQVTFDSLFHTWPTYDQLRQLTPISVAENWKLIYNLPEHTISLLFKQQTALTFLPDNSAIVHPPAFYPDCFISLAKLLQRTDGFPEKPGDVYVNGKPTNDCTERISCLKETIESLFLLLNFTTPRSASTLIGVRISVDSNGTISSVQARTNILVNGRPLVGFNSFLKSIVSKLVPKTGWPPDRTGSFLITLHESSYTEKVLLASRAQTLLSSIEIDIDWFVALNQS